MGTPTSGSGRHRRRIRFALPVAAAGIAAAVTAALISTSASAATLPAPTVKSAVSTTSQATLKQRVLGAVAAVDRKTTATTTTTAKASSSGSAVSPKIIGGGTTTISSAPWMAQLWYWDKKGTTSTSDDIAFFCGGSVVSPTKILTAAHCVRDENGKAYNWAANGYVVTGATKLPDDTGLNGGTVTGVLRQWNHPSTARRPSTTTSPCSP